LGYLTDNTRAGSFGVICQDLYKFRVVIEPGFASDLDLRGIIKDVLPDIEEWQYSGRRRLPLTGGKLSRVVSPSSYALNSRKMRQFEERVIFAFHTEVQRDAVTARLTTRGFKFTIEDEPNPLSTNVVIIVVP